MENPFKNSNWKLLIVFTILIWIYYCLAEKLIHIFSDTPLFTYIRKIYNIICNYSGINLLLLLSSIGLACYIAVKIWLDQDFRWWRILSILVCAIVLWYPKDMFTYPIVYGSIDYRVLWTILLSIISFVCFILIQSVKQNNLSSGFVTDTELFNRGNNKKLTKSIVSRLLTTNLSTKSFTLGITGEWGTGKTTFLDDLINQFGDKAEIIRFNPWMCKSPDQVITDFFNVLREKLSSTHSRLSRPIVEYASFLTEAASLSTVSSLFAKLSFSWPRKDSLQSRREYLSEQFKQMKKPVVVCIDDLDRLDSNEIFEVLRLIRNTADFCNMIYIVTYDKNYVTKVLSGKNIEDANAYIEKIFNVELHLPKVDDSQLFEMFCRCLEQQIISTSNEQLTKNQELLHFLRRMILDDVEQILSILTSYRKIKIFTRQYALSYDYLFENHKNDIDYQDLFWLELLEFYDKKTYDQLYINPKELLDITLTKNRIERYLLKDEIEKQKDQETRNYILLKLFGKKELRNSNQSNRISTVASFDNYFQMRMPDNYLSASDFSQIIKCKPDNIGEIVDKWKNKNEKSVFNQFINNNPQNMIVRILNQENETIKIKALLHYVIMVKKASVETLINKQFNVLMSRDGYDPNVQAILNKTCIEWFKNAIDKCENKNTDDDIRFSIAISLKVLYSEYDVRNNVSKDGSYFINNHEIEQLLNYFMQQYLNKHPETKAIDIMDMFSPVGRLFSLCCVPQKYDSDSDDSFWRNVAFKSVTNHFAKTPEFTTTAFEKAKKDSLDKLEAKIRVHGISFSNPDEEREYENSIVEQIDYKFETYFGSSNQDLETFIERCSLNDRIEKPNV